MNLKLGSLLSSILCAAILFTACKKDDKSSNSNNDNDEVSTAISDESQVSTEMDAIAEDASTAIEYDGSFSGNNQVVDQIICDATVDYSISTDPMTITITYDGSNCGNGRTRTGSIVLSMEKGTEWKTAGAHFTITFNNLKITKTSTNKSITISGTHIVTNTSGGLLVDLPTSQPITHTITSENMKVSFDNGTAREWHVAKQRLYTYDNGVVLSVSGIHEDGDDLSVAEWGTNRGGTTFKTSTITPIIIKQSCNFRITGGTIKHTTQAWTGVVTFGLNASGEPTTCPGSDSFYYKLVWSGNNGGSLNLILPY